MPMNEVAEERTQAFRGAAHRGGRDGCAAGRSGPAQEPAGRRPGHPQALRAARQPARGRRRRSARPSTRTSITRSSSTRSSGSTSRTGWRFRFTAVSRSPTSRRPSSPTWSSSLSTDGRPGGPPGVRADPVRGAGSMQKIKGIYGAQLEVTPFTASTRCSASCSPTTTSYIFARSGADQRRRRTRRTCRPAPGT